MLFAKLIPVALILTSLISTSAHAIAVNKDFEYENLPRNWQPTLSFYNIGLQTDFSQGVFFFEVSTDVNTGTSRIVQVHVLYDRSKGNHKFYHEDQTIKPLEMVPDKKNSYGYVVRSNSGRRVITLATTPNEAGDQHETVRMTVLKEANAFGSDDYASAPVTIHFKLNQIGVVEASLDPLPGKTEERPFNIMAITPLMKRFGLSKTAAGISKIEFYNNAVDAKHKVPGPDYTP